MDTSIPRNPLMMHSAGSMEHTDTYVNYDHEENEVPLSSAHVGLHMKRKVRHKISDKRRHSVLLCIASNGIFSLQVVSSHDKTHLNYQKSSQYCICSICNNLIMWEVHSIIILVLMDGALRDKVVPGSRSRWMCPP